LFIDDSARNTNGAKEHGLNTLLFRSPEQLKEELVRMKIL
jgi:hypothetical protein